jgi:hypothetical protein
MPGLFIPLPGSSTVPFMGQPTVKGQLYAMDLNDKIDFQFNPTVFEFEQAFTWSRITYKGDFSGGDLDFQNVGPRKFDLPLLFLADPAAPPINFTAESSEAEIVHKEPGLDQPILFDYDELLKMLDFWKRPIEGKNRPTRIQVVMGQRSFEGVITNLAHRELEFFRDMGVKEALITITFEEWNLERDNT